MTWLLTVIYVNGHISWPKIIILILPIIMVVSPPFFEGRDGEKINCRVCLSVGAYGHVIDDLALLAELFSVDGSFRPLVAKGVLMLLKSANYNYYFVKLFE